MKKKNTKVNYRILFGSFVSIGLGMWSGLTACRTPSIEMGGLAILSIGATVYLLDKSGI